MIETKIALGKTAEDLLRMMEDGRIRGESAEFPVSGVLKNEIQNPHGFNLWINPGDSTAEDIAAYFSALSDLNMAHGGLGFTFKNAGYDEGHKAFKVQVLPNTLGCLETPPHQFEE